MKAVVKKWGNSASVRIPAAVLQAAKLRLDDSVDVREESGRIVIEPAPRKEYTLSELLKGITPDNLHEEADFGRPNKGADFALSTVTCLPCLPQAN
jgi:antitoxin MazE